MPIILWVRGACCHLVPMALLLASRAARRLRPRSRASAAAVFFAPGHRKPSPFIPILSPKRLETLFSVPIGSPGYHLLGLRQTLSLASITSSSSSGNPNKEEDEDEKPRNRRSVASNSSWIDLYLPHSVRPYALLARLDKPIGTWLLAWPCFW